jgi:hypothetical protein
MYWGKVIWGSALVGVRLPPTHQLNLCGLAAMQGLTTTSLHYGLENSQFLYLDGLQPSDDHVGKVTLAG